MSMNGKTGGGSRASDEDGKTSVKVGMLYHKSPAAVQRHADFPCAAVRVRPPLTPSDPGFELIPQRFQRSILQVTSPTSLSIESPQGRKLFVFDKVFSEDVTQEGVWDYLVESTNSFVQGYNVSMLAYGQSGAGKSYTMGTSGPIEQSNLDVMGKSIASFLFRNLCLVLRSILPYLGTNVLLYQVSFHVLLQPYLRNSRDPGLVLGILCPAYEHRLDTRPMLRQ